MDNAKKGELTETQTEGLSKRSITEMLIFLFRQWIDKYYQNTLTTQCPQCHKEYLRMMSNDRLKMIDSINVTWHEFAAIIYLLS